MRYPAALLALALLALLLAAACAGGSGDANGTPTAAPPVTTAPDATASAATATLEPAPDVVVPNTAPAAEIVLPDGFTAYVIASDFLRTSTIALGPNGELYVSERHGIVYREEDANGDGVYEKNNLFADGFDDITGLLVAPDGALLISTKGRVVLARDTDGDGVADQQSDIVSDLPTGRHQNNGLVLSDDGKLYLTLGSTCDDCVEGEEQSATILQMNPDGSELRVYATGLRNPYDLAFDSQGRLWATDNGSDAPCATVDELNLIVDGGDYGWPYGEDGCDPYQDGTPPVADLGLHTASTGVTVYEAAHFPSMYRSQLFATVWGSFFAEPDPYDRVLLRIAIDEAGAGDSQPTGAVEEFGSGFLHPIDLLVDHDGTLLVLDYGGDDPEERTGKLYRIIYSGD